MKRLLEILVHYYCSHCGTDWKQESTQHYLCPGCGRTTKK